MVVYKGLSSPQTMLFVGQVPRGGPPCSVPHTCLPPSLHPIHPYTTARAVLTLGKHTMAKVNMMGGSTQQQDACQVEEPPLKEEVTPPWVSTVAAVDTQQQRLGDTGGRPNARRGNTHTTLGSVYRWPLRCPARSQALPTAHLATGRLRRKPALFFIMLMLMLSPLRLHVELHTCALAHGTHKPAPTLTLLPGP
jgi:hypothetical protein